MGGESRRLAPWILKKPELAWKASAALSVHASVWAPRDQRATLFLLFVGPVHYRSDGKVERAKYGSRFWSKTRPGAPSYLFSALSRLAKSLSTWNFDDYLIVPARNDREVEAGLALIDVGD